MGLAALRAGWRQNPHYYSRSEKGPSPHYRGLPRIVRQPHYRGVQLVQSDFIRGHPHYVGTPTVPLNDGFFVYPTIL